jgi:hypothetical protein
VAVVPAESADAKPVKAPPTITWKKTILDRKFRSEGVAVADVNKDGKIDVLNGEYWYEAPDWTPHEIRPAKEYNGATGYSNAFLVFAQDVDGDHWTDELVVGFPGSKATWYKNPGKAGGAWKEYPITDVAGNESPSFTDIDGDGVPELVTPFNEKQMTYYKPGPHPETGFEQHAVGAPGTAGTQRFSHGLGVGDINGDGRPDILCTDGYWLQPPASERSNPLAWTFVPAKLGPACAQMYTYDVNGDGLMDVMSSSAHNFGVWWYEQVKGANGPEFVQHTIDTSFSQSHSMVMADINRDGQPDFVTGKRFWAHGPNGDVDPGGIVYLYWYEFKRNNGQVEWTRHQIDSDSGVGTQFTVARVNNDRLLDVATSNKKGVYLFTQER